jgi:hypothetical protein
MRLKGCIAFITVTNMKAERIFKEKYSPKDVASLPYSKFFSVNQEKLRFYKITNAEKNVSTTTIQEVVFDLKT